MRTKFKFWAVEYLKNNLKNQFVIDSFNEEEFNKFISSKPTFLEIGPGKGKFIIEIAKKFPNYNFLVVELNQTIAGMCLKAIDDNELTNVKLVGDNFYKLIPLLKDNKFDGLFLNFSDPWPKKRHEKRRLTSDQFLDAYKQIIKFNHFIYYKTDNLDFFNYSLEQFQKHNFEIVYQNNDYQEDEEFDAMTEFEERYRGQGIKINRLVLKINEKTLKTRGNEE